MPWRECSVMEERLRFVARLLDGEGMSAVCREFGISRKTGYKIWNRYRQEGAYALCDRSRRPVRYANQLPEQIERLGGLASRRMVTAAKSAEMISSGRGRVGLRVREPSTTPVSRWGAAGRVAASSDNQTSADSRSAVSGIRFRLASIRARQRGPRDSASS
jgi:transposase-like protein